MPSTLKGLRDESIAREKVEGRSRVVNGNRLETIIQNVTAETILPDDVTIESVSNVFGVKDSGIDTDQLADDAVTTAKIDAGAVTETEIANDAVTNAKLAEMAALTVKSNVTGGDANPSDNTLTAIIDAAIGSTQGQIAYRNATVWTALAPGTSGHFLKTNGAGADPAWAAGGGGASAFTDLTDVPGDYTGEAGNIPTVNGTEDGLEFATRATVVGTAIHNASAKTTPVDADTMPLIDSAASNVLKKVTWANIKATIQALTDSLYMKLAAAFALPVIVTDVISGHLTDYAPTGHATAQQFILTFDAGGPYEFRSLAGGADGRLVFGYNDGTTKGTIKDNYTGGTTAAMRFDIPSDLDWYPGEWMAFLYYASISRWRVIPFCGLKITSGGAELARQLDIANTATVNLALSTLTNGVTELTADVNDGSITAAKLAAGALPWTMLSKAANEARISNNTLTDDDTMAFAMAASTKYRIRFYVWFDTTAAGDFKYEVLGPSSPTLLHAEILAAAAGSSSPARTIYTAYTGSQALTGTGTTAGFIKGDMIVHNGANSGTFAFRFAQNSSQADTGAIVLAGSYMEYSIA